MSMAANTPMIAITVSSSMSVNPRELEIEGSGLCVCIITKINYDRSDISDGEDHC